MRNHFKISFIGLFGLIFLCGCSSDDGMYDANEVEQYNPVEISLSARDGNSVSVSPTRAALVGDQELDVPNIGIFSLARAIQDVYHSPSEIVWFNSVKNATGCIMNNVASHKKGTDIIWDDITAKYFYPLTQIYSYEFYGYYPYQPSENLEYFDNIVKANYVLDGKTDLLWGRTHNRDPYAFSAKYFRTNSSTDTYKPSIELEHLLTRLVFSVVPGESYEGSGDYSEAAMMQIDTLQIIDTYTNVAVTIADYNNLDMTLSDRINLSNETTDTLSLYSVDEEGNGIDLQPVHLVAPEPGEEPIVTPLGESIMLFPQDRYTIRIVITMDAYHDAATNTEVPSKRLVSEIPLQLASTFEQGKSYNVKITVHGPRAVKLAATLTPWEVQEGPSIEL